MLPASRSQRLHCAPPDGVRECGEISGGKRGLCRSRYRGDEGFRTLTVSVWTVAVMITVARSVVLFNANPHLALRVIGCTGNGGDVRSVRGRPNRYGS